VEDTIVTLCAWHLTQSTHLDYHNLLLGMIKIRLPQKFSTVLYKSLTMELDNKLLVDLRHTFCIPKCSELRPLLKIAGMLTYKMTKLGEFITKDFPCEAGIELINLI
jgi:hypothetical protein